MIVRLPGPRGSGPAVPVVVAGSGTAADGGNFGVFANCKACRLLHLLLTNSC